MKIVLSSDLDEYEIERLSTEGDFDIAGVGTRVATSEDAPSLGGVYKLVQIGDRPVAKFSQQKVTYPGAHQVYRHEKDGRFSHDHLGFVKEPAYEFVNAIPLLVPAMKGGVPVHRETIHDMRARAKEGLAKLPANVATVGPRVDTYETHYDVRISDQLSKSLEKLRNELADQT